MNDKQDVVGVFSDDGKQVFAAARAMRLQVVRDSKTMQHPLETGGSVVDHRIIMPAEATLQVDAQAKDYKQMYSEIAANFNSGAMLTVQCRASSYANMYIASMPHEETPDAIDKLTIVLKLVEAQFFKSQATASTAGRNSKSSNTAKRGEQSGKQRETLLYKIFK